MSQHRPADGSQKLRRARAFTLHRGRLELTSKHMPGEREVAAEAARRIGTFLPRYPICLHRGQHRTLSHLNANQSVSSEAICRLLRIALDVRQNGAVSGKPVTEMRYVAS